MRSEIHRPIGVVALAASLALAGGCMRDEYTKSIDAWHETRLARLRAPDGWLSLVGLVWLREGENRAGSAASNDLVFPPKAPAEIGTFVRHGRAVEVHAAPGVPLTLADGKPLASPVLKSDAGGEPTKLRLGSLVFFVIERGDRVGLRVRDEDSPLSTSFGGIERFPVDRRWRVEGRFEPYEPERTLEVSTVIGTVEPSPSPGAVVFEIGGRRLRLDTVEEEGESDLFVVFADATSGKETYGAGRFLYVPRPGPDGRVVVDFNRAYNPPCAFTPFATCPLPPPQNRLPVRIEAGEKKVAGH